MIHRIYYIRGRDVNPEEISATYHPKSGLKIPLQPLALLGAQGEKGVEEHPWEDSCLLRGGRPRGGGARGKRDPEPLPDWGQGRNVVFGDIQVLTGFLDPTCLNSNEYFMSKALAEAWAGKDSLLLLPLPSPPPPLALFFFFFPKVRKICHNIYQKSV